MMPLKETDCGGGCGCCIFYFLFLFLSFLNKGIWICWEFEIKK